MCPPPPPSDPPPTTPTKVVLGATCIIGPPHTGRAGTNVCGGAAVWPLMLRPFTTEGMGPCPGVGGSGRSAGAMQF